MEFTAAGQPDAGQRRPHALREPMTRREQVSISGDESALHTSMDDPGVFPRRQVRLRLEAAFGKRYRPHRVSSTVNQSPMAVRVCFVLGIV